MKRARGSGGRFLNTKQLEEQKQQQEASSGASCTKSPGNRACLQSGPNCTPSAPAPAETASVSTSGKMAANQEHIRFPSAGFLPTVSFSSQNGGDGKLVANAMHQRVSMMR
ncbi:hypothetical protein ABZP36_002230 [Zizania latifolia]